MKLFQFPITTIYLARLFLVFVRTPLRLLLCSLTLCGITFLTAAPAQAQTFARPLTFEQNRGQAPNEVKWIGQGSSYRILFEGDGATMVGPLPHMHRLLFYDQRLTGNTRVQREYSGKRQHVHI